MAVIISTLFMAGCTGNRSNKQESEQAPEEATLTVAADGELLLLVGTYTSRGGSEGMYLYRFDSRSGSADSLSMAKVDNPSYLTVSPDEKFVYAVSESSEQNSAVHAFSLDKKQGRLEPINSRPVNSGGPCYITIDKRGQNVHTANYGGGSISTIGVNEDGSLAGSTLVMQFEGSGTDSTRQQAPHLHMVSYTPDGQFLLASDLGTDHLYRFQVNDSPFEGQPPIHESSLHVWETPAGTGPRHFDFHPNGRYLYLLGELSGEVIVYDYHYGEIEQKQVILSDTTGARGSADIHVSPDGHFLYSSNRLQADGIAIFEIDQQEGTLTKVRYQLTGTHPRNFAITPNGNYLLVASRDDNKIQVFKRDQETGMLTDTGQDIIVSRPTCVKFAAME